MVYFSGFRRQLRRTKSKLGFDSEMDDFEIFRHKSLSSAQRTGIFAERFQFIGGTIVPHARLRSIIFYSLSNYKSMNYFF